MALDVYRGRKTTIQYNQVSNSLTIRCVYCVYSNSRNDVPRVAQWYGTIAAHTLRRASVLVVFVVFCVHMHSFAGFIWRTPSPTFNDTAITDRHSDTTISQLRAYWVRISWSIGSEKIVRTCALYGSRTLDFLHAGRAPYPLFRALRCLFNIYWFCRGRFLSIKFLSRDHIS